LSYLTVRPRVAGSRRVRPVDAGGAP
jgi:hypothetical protein